MKEGLFIPKPYYNKIKEGSVTWQSPSNIALVKYWGKKENQIPANPSISFTLKNCRTVTTLNYSLKKGKQPFDFDVYFEGREHPLFKPKIEAFFSRIVDFVPFISEYRFTIETNNTFPHSSGIASSASGMSALALCLMSLENLLVKEQFSKETFFRKASFLARLGSGSACRSLKGDVVVWGKHSNIDGSSDLYGIEFPYKIHDVFKDYQDCILLVDKGQKEVSSTVGHGLLNNHPFAESRYQQASSNLTRLKEVLETGTLDRFIEIVESEALTLHALMMSSTPYFILMKPNTLSIINKVWSFRKKTSSKICFTLDAGANVHLLYPKTESETVMAFIKEELTVFCHDGQFINDEVGQGSNQIV